MSTCTKTSFASEAEAWRSLVEFAFNSAVFRGHASRPDRRRAGPTRPYECTRCRQWHTTSRPLVGQMEEA